MNNGQYAFVVVLLFLSVFMVGALSKNVKEIKEAIIVKGVLEDLDRDMLLKTVKENSVTEEQVVDLVKELEGLGLIEEEIEVLLNGERGVIVDGEFITLDKLDVMDYD